MESSLAWSVDVGTALVGGLFFFTFPEGTAPEEWSWNKRNGCPGSGKCRKRRLGQVLRGSACHV